MVPRLAVVGIRGYGASHVTKALELQSQGRLRLTAVVDPVVSGDAPDVPLFTDLDSLLAHEVPDVVVIATPIHTHAKLAGLAVQAGSHVLLEKPPTATYSDFEDLSDFAASMGRVVQVGFQARGSKALPVLRSELADGAIGEIRGVGGLGLWSRRRGYYDRAPWAGRRELDGVAVMDGVATNPLAHTVDVGLLVAGATGAGDLAEIRVEPFQAHGIQTDDTTAIAVKTAAGVRVGFGLTTCAEHPLRPTVAVEGSEGSVTFDYARDTLHWHRRGTRSTTTCSRVSLMENLLDHLESGTDLLCPLSSTAPFMRVAEALRVGPAPEQIPDAFVHWEGEGDDARPVVAGAAEACRAVAKQRLLFSEVGALWADNVHV